MIIFKTPEKLSLVTNYHKFLFLPVQSDPDGNLKNKNQSKIYDLVTVTSNKLYFQSFHIKFKCTTNKRREPNFRHNFQPFTSWGMHGLSI